MLTLVTTPMLIGHGKKKAVLEFVSAGTMVISAVIKCNEIAETTVGNTCSKKRKEEENGNWVINVGVFAASTKM